MNFSSAGLKEGLIKALKVLGWVIASGVVTYLIGYVANFQNSVDYGYVYLIVNPLLAGMKVWLETHPQLKKK